MAATAQSVIQMTDEEFQRQTLDLIKREFGLSGLVRFIRAYRSGRGDYTADRQTQHPDLTVDEIWREFEAQGAIHKQ